MQKTSTYVYNQPTKAEKTIHDIKEVTTDINTILTAIDRALNPAKYSQPVQAQPFPQKKSGMGWAKWLLLAGTAGGLAFGGKQLYEEYQEEQNED